MMTNARPPMSDDFLFNPLDPADLVLDPVLAFFLGGLLGLIFARPKVRLDRAPFLAFAGLLLLVSDLIWATPLLLQGPQAAGDYASAPPQLPIGFVPTLLIGYVYARLAAARARPAFGATWPAILAIIPGPGWLLLAIFPNRKDAKAPPARLPEILTGDHGIQIGVAFLLTRNLLHWYLRNSGLVPSLFG